MKKSPPATPTRRAQRAATRPILGFLDRIEDAHIAGWAFDPIDPATPLTMRVMIDGTIADVLTCDVNRPDVSALNLPSTKVGFEYAIPAKYQDGLRHVLSLAGIDGVPIHLPGRGGIILPELHFCLTRQVRIDGVLDGLVDGLLQGWVLRVDQRSNEKSGGVRIMVTAQGQPITELVADQFRGDVAEALGCDPACGFSFVLPPALRLGRRVKLDFHAMPERVQLRGAPIEITVPTSQERSQIAAMIERTDEMFRFAYNLRRELKAALPTDRYSLADYPSWAEQNTPLILPRATQRYGALAGEPRVSVLCPVYRPVLAEFLAAVDSVRAQTYPHWELILVDDASRDDTLSATLAELAKLDPRIRVLTQAKNGGIAAATNLALDAAQGDFVAFFDHDDVMIPCALEVMMRAQAATGARLLYSDEDKIDARGRVSEPNFKPDFNYRFLLDLNYICHLVVAETALVRAAGGLDPRFDGAQDHDLLLRLTEHLRADEVHHVAEILYHWRITAQSTAGGASAKPRAALAGEVAVAEHLKRRRLAAKVERRGALTCYQTQFTSQADPGVSILIPYRNHIALTRQCVEAIRKQTSGVNYEIILLDNWSDGVDAEKFAVEQGNLPNTQVLKIAEPFNYSAINNRGVAAARYPYLLFLNNDVFVKDESWLRTLLNEALADPGAGAIGAKLLYPNGTVQHAGVVLGVGGVADHAFRGLGAAEPGYIAHAMTAREVAAVTAACMLVRRDAFEQVGGFDAEALGVAFNDVDLCLKLRKAGYRILFTPDVVCEHRESMSRGDDLGEEKLARFMLENEVMRVRWGDTLPFDPFYNRQFAREGGVYRDLRIIEPAQETPWPKMPKAADIIAPDIIAPVMAARGNVTRTDEPHAASATRTKGKRGSRNGS